jgi:hypothetical protein
VAFSAIAHHDEDRTPGDCGFVEARGLRWRDRRDGRLSFGPDHKSDEGQNNDDEYSKNEAKKYLQSTIRSDSKTFCRLRRFPDLPRKERGCHLPLIEFTLG